MRADLHIHSRYSDGGHWPIHIARLVHEAGLEAACLCDHDTLGGYIEFSQAAQAVGVKTWPAVEIDCIDTAIAYKSEILAYFPEYSYSATDAFLARGREVRRLRIAGLFDRAGSLFGTPKLSFEQLLIQRSSGRPAGSPVLDPSDLRFSKTDLFLALRSAGSLPESANYREFEKAYFDTGLVSDICFEKPELEWVAALVAKDGGVLVVPHVGHEFGDSLQTMKAESKRLDALLSRFRDLGVHGVELYDYRNDDSQAINAFVTEACSSYGFFHTYGSDCHGPGSAKPSLGGFYGDFEGFATWRKQGKD